MREKIIEQTRATTISLVDSSIESIRANDVVRTGLRLYKNQHIGVAGALGTCDLTELERRARKAHDLAIPYPYPLEAGLTRHVTMRCNLTDAEQGLDETEELLRELRRHEDFRFSGKVKLISDVTEHTNDQELDLRAELDLVMLSLIFKEANSGSIMDGHVGYMGRDYQREEFVNHVREVLDAYRTQVALPKSEEMPIVMVARDYRMDSPYNFFAHALSARSFATGASVLAKHHRSKIFSDRFTLCQCRDPQMLLGPFFDAEGVVLDGDRLPLIQAGRVITPFADKKSAADFDLPHTGAASAAYDGLPALGCPPLDAEASNQTIEELLNGRKAIFVFISQGGDFTPDGQFAAPVQLAFLFDGQHLIGRLPSLKVSSTVFDMFGDAFIGISKDTWPAMSNHHLLATTMKVTAT